LTETLGQFLKREREFRGITIDRLAGMTRINSAVLKQIEGDDYRAPLKPVYIRSFLKTYAGSLGIDPQDVLGRYEGQAGSEPAPAALPVPVEKSVGPFRWVALISVLAVAAAAATILLLRRAHWFAP
jgi:cytoskeletal protein RodZ